MVTFYHLSNEQKPGCSGYTGDEILPSSMGIAISHYKHPVMNQPVWWDIIIVLKFWTLLGCGEHFTWKHGYIQLHHCSLHGCICRPAHRPKRPKPKTRWWFQCFFNFHPYLGRIPILTSIFQMSWNHQPEEYSFGQNVLYRRVFAFTPPENEQISQVPFGDDMVRFFKGLHIPSQGTFEDDFSISQGAICYKVGPPYQLQMWL